MVVKIKSNKNLNYYQIKIKEKIMRDKRYEGIAEFFDLPLGLLILLSGSLGGLFCIAPAIATGNNLFLLGIPLKISFILFLKYYSQKRYVAKTCSFKIERSVQMLHGFNVESFGKIGDKYYRDIKNNKIYDLIEDIQNYENTIFKNNHKTSKNYEKYVVFCFVHLMPLIKNTDVIVNNYEQKEIIDFIESAHKSITSYVKKESNKDLELLQFDKLWYDSYNKKVEERELINKEKENDFSNLLK